jgi:UDP-glucose 4-epimerase
MKVVVTGAAGFIGSNLVDRLLAHGHEVTGYDNFSTGREEFLRGALESPGFRLVRGDLLDSDSLHRAIDGAELVFHMAANADVRYGTAHPGKDLEQNTIATFNVLEAMRSGAVRRMVFPSTGSVYGEPQVFPTPEDAPFPVQTSLYAASKLAAEGLIEAYCEGFGMEAHIFRFVSILGERYTHGHVFDFCKQLLDHPEHLDVLGDGLQRKSYLFVQDCIDAMLLAIERDGPRVNPDGVKIYNLGSDEYCTVNDSIGWIAGRLGCSPRLNYGGGKRGWVGDSPFIFLECSRIRALGWRPKLTIREAVLKTVDYLLSNRWLWKAV